MLKLSYSRLQVAKTCDLKYYLQYDQKVKSPRKRSGALIVGSAGSRRVAGLVQR